MNETTRTLTTDLNKCYLEKRTEAIRIGLRIIMDGCSKRGLKENL